MSSWIEELYEEKGEVAPHLANQPELLISSEAYWEAFWALIGSRPVGFSVGPIPHSEISAYMNDLGMTNRDDREDMKKFIQFLDIKYLDHLHTKRERKAAIDAKKKTPK